MALHLCTPEEWSTLSLSHIIQLHGQRMPDWPLFTYPSKDFHEPIKVITWKDFALAVQVAEELIKSRVSDRHGRATPPVVAILANLGEHRYIEFVLPDL